MADLSAHRLFDRRAALRLIAGGCSALPFAAAPALARSPDVSALQSLAAIIPSTAAAKLAARLRELHGGAPGVEREFQDELQWLRRGARAYPARSRLAAEVRRRVRDDFAGGRVLRFDGWILSRTELALCHAASPAAPLDDAQPTGAPS